MTRYNLSFVAIEVIILFIDALQKGFLFDRLNLVNFVTALLAILLSIP